ncbi:MAG TPA: lamin tail domain-containing protein [Candidatus Paceibacterota bacterium]|nr:lamin tail domain-containing protein [Candidatus Paceibacterota bacterium]
MAIPIGVSAAAAITEIMYDAPGTDSGREWVEVQNNGLEAFDLSSWKFFEGGVNHKITAITDSILTAGGFAIIADNTDKFKADNPGFSGLLFDSAFSLSNEGETLSLVDEAGNQADSILYTPSLGAAGDGNTLQKTTTGEWLAAASSIGSPTIATESVASPADTDDGTSNNPTDASGDGASGGTSGDDQVFSAHSSQEVATISYDKPQFEVTAGRPRIGFVGAPLTFETKVLKSKDVAAGSGLRSVWSMGDGTLIVGQIISHAYDYPGEYIVVTNADYGGSHAVAKVKVRIVAPDLSLSILPGRVMIRNGYRGEVNIGGFIFEDSQKRFIFPQDTIIAPLSSIEISFGATRIDEPRDFLRIADPAGKILSQVPVPNLSIVTSSTQDLTIEEVTARLIRALSH